MKHYGVLLLTVVLVMSLSGVVWGESELDGKYVTFKDTTGKVITRTAHEVNVGDEYINSENHLYRVIGITGQTAQVKLIKEDALKASAWSNIRSFVFGLISGEFFGAQARPKGPVCVYHTHSDESYIQGDGTSSLRGRGGIFDIGDTLTNAFEQNGIPVVHSRTPHDPHDAAAYDRSRRTAAQLLRNRPACLLDIHRDAVPREEYASVINNQGVTKVQLVVGRQNPNFQANNDFAKQIKATCDKRSPGLVKGIFYGKGKYNQDLGPRSMLIEVGSHTNSKAAAERGARIFAAAAKDVLYGNAGSGFINRGSMRSIFWVVVAALGGIGLYLLLNREGLKDIKKEFTGALGEQPDRERPESKQDKNGDSP